MVFLNWIMLLGLSALAVPIVIHLLSRRKARVVDWGAMQFLLASIVNRSRRLRIEEMLLLALRCAAIALVVLAMARPLATPHAALPWHMVLPGALAAAALVAASGVFWHRRNVRWLLMGAAVAIVATVAAASARQRMDGPSAGSQDVAIIIDASSSMTVRHDGKSSFERALAEARTVVQALRPGDAASVILAGPVPRELTAGPVSDGELLLEAIAQARPRRGAMAVRESLLAAAVSLEDGRNVSKRIIVITDGQRLGWEGEIPALPPVLVRTLGLGESLTNAAISDLAPSRQVVGTDRPVHIDVQVDSLGNRRAQPGEVSLAIDGRALATRPIEPMEPGSSQTVRFEASFEEPGSHVLTARLSGSDDLAADNEASRVVHVVKALPVLIVSSSSLSAGASGAEPLEMALAPGLDEPNLVSPQVIEAGRLSTLTSFDAYACVVLCDVPTLPDAVAARLADFVHRGGGLLVLPGAACMPAFYNDWKTPTGQLLMPARLDRPTRHDTPLHPAPDTIDHPAIGALADRKTSDIASAAFDVTWSLQPRAAGMSLSSMASLDDGSAMLVLGQAGRGRVILSAVPFGDRGGNLAGRRAFVPLVHQLTYYLAGPVLAQFNAAPARTVTVSFGPPPGANRMELLRKLARPVELSGQGPDDQPLRASLRARESLVRLVCDTVDQAGLCRLGLPPQLRESLADMSDGQGNLLIAVTAEPAEGHLRPLTPADFARLDGQTRVTQVTSVHEIVTALNEGLAGRELWRQLALAALAAILAERLLAWWIWRQRKAGQDGDVDFAAGQKAQRPMRRAPVPSEVTP
jgi:hypothetical protein